MRKAAYVILVFASLLSGCGTTTIIPSNPQNDIYVDQAFIGKGTAKVTRMGPPRKIFIEEKSMGRVVGEINEKRKFDFVTFLLGCYTYGTGFLVCWRYPEKVVIPAVIRSNWDNAGTCWEQPGSKWKK